MGDMDHYYVTDAWKKTHPFGARDTSADPKPDESNPPPVPNLEMPIVDMVIIELLQRKQVGISRYGTPLQANNGRNAIRDALEESIDQTLYLYQAWREGLAQHETQAARDHELQGWRSFEAVLFAALTAISSGTNGMWEFARTHKLNENPHASDEEIAKLIANFLLEIGSISVERANVPDSPRPRQG